MNRVYIGLGSNLGNSRKILLDAWKRLGLAQDVFLLALSSPYSSDPVAMESGNRFVNAVGILETGLGPKELLYLLQAVEKDFGRTKKSEGKRYQDRLLDLDILYFADLVSQTAELVLPHPQIAGRLFVLLPLLEVDPEKTDPVTQLGAAEMYAVLQEKIAAGERAPQAIEKSAWNMVE